MGIENFKTEKSSKKKRIESIKKYTDEDLINDLKRFKDEYGSISQKNFDMKKDYPASKTIANRFGSWNNGLKKAGIKENVVQIDNDEKYKEPSSNKAYIVGVILGDASVSSDKTIQLQVNDKEFAKAFAIKLCSYLDLNWYGWEDEKTQLYTTKTRNNMWRVQRGVSSLYSHLLKYQRVESSEDIIDEFKKYAPSLLRGLWDSDGSFDSSHGIRFSNSRDGTIDIYANLLRKEVNTNDITVSEKGHRGTRTVRLPCSYTEEFFYLVNPTIERKREIILDYIQ